MRQLTATTAIFLLGSILVPTLSAADVIRLIPLTALQTPTGALKPEEQIGAATIREGEALPLTTTAGTTQALVVRLRQESALSGVVVIIPTDSAPRPVAFTVARDVVTAAADGTRAFAAASAERAHRHLNAERGEQSLIPQSVGSAARSWWTWRIAEAEKIDPAYIAPPIEGNRRNRDERLDDTIDFFTGMTALNENLQFDRALTVSGDGDATVLLSTLPTLTMREVPWDLMPSAKDPQPKLDLLAQHIPADQHALLLPSFSALTTTMDQGDALLAGPLHVIAGRGEDAGILRRYQRQLGLELNDLSKRFGAQVVEAVAITGSDPFVRAGTDVAILLLAKQPALLAGYLDLKRKALLASGAKLVTGTTNGLAWQAAVSADRSVSSYVLFDGDVAVVTNSLVQIEAYTAVRAKTRPALASVPELTFFRRRYLLASDGEVALTVISDATIRRWCSAACRIGDSRRSRAAVILSQYQAEWIAAGCTADWMPSAARDDLGTISVDPKRGVRSSLYGSVHFLTPVAELAIEKATTSEAEAFRRFIQRYESSWRDSLDPIALRVQTMADGSLGFDLSVLPLIVRSDYVDLLRWVGKARISAGNGDQHASAFQFAVAMDRDGEILGEANQNASRLLGGLASPFGWLGDTASVYADYDPFWAELAQMDPNKLDRVVEQRLSELPIGINIGVRDPLKLVAFLGGLRAFAEQSAPGMLKWETVTFDEIPYVRVSPTAEARAGMLGNIDVHLLYLAAPEGFTLTFSSKVMERAITRLKERRAAKAAAVSDPSWDGNQAAFRLDPRSALSLLQVFDRSAGLKDWMDGRTADTIAILNEWHRLFPQEDPLAVHERLWGTRPLCVGGGTFRWNDTWMTMESSVLGHDFSDGEAPALPAALDHLGVITTALTFDEIPNAPRVAGALAPGEVQVVVKDGDTWFSLAGDHGVNANALARRNQAQVNEAPAVGRQVIIPRWDTDRTRSVGLRVRVNLRAAEKTDKPVPVPAVPKASPIP
jgi:hypothetical protein